ncbi:unnamed protein product [Larinioides sclopetarius]|uniref:Uncharacterized protein n=1 Tax=Larinioides sclopetarius TaxID=280406 RepID=A0AAV1ZCJ3_9ARAC
MQYMNREGAREITNIFRYQFWLQSQIFDCKFTTVYKLSDSVNCSPQYEPAALKDINDPDWAPSLFLGHNYFRPDKHGKGKSGNEIEDLLYDPSKGRKWHPLLEQKKYYEETHSDEVIDIIEWRASLERKDLSL